MGKNIWKYVMVYDSHNCMDDQSFACSLAAAYEYARILDNPIFMEICGDECVYVVICESTSTMSKDEYMEAIMVDGGEQELSI